MKEEYGKKERESLEHSKPYEEDKEYVREIERRIKVTAEKTKKFS